MLNSVIIGYCKNTVFSTLHLMIIIPKILLLYIIIHLFSCLLSLLQVQYLS